MAAETGSRPGYHIGPHRFEAARPAPGLYIVATPIGNLGDMTIRALETLATADLVACEDTRVTRVLLDRYGLKPRLTAYHEHNAAAERPRILAALAEGKVVALVSDAGTPLVSDPGYKLVEAAAAAGHKVVPLPGASALLAALVVSALPSDTVLFAGFLPARTEARRRRIEELAPVPATLVLYESPHRLAESLADLADRLGPERPAAVARELTKAFEETVRGSLGELAGRWADKDPRGEIVIVIGPPAPAEAGPDDIDRMLRAALERLPPGKAAAEVARLLGADRKALYERALTLKAGDVP
ncbi:16S rRNA (cytidine(1402)-2'-O)-methyltransferase [Prosthecomicrobium sp. N25]